MSDPFFSDVCDLHQWTGKNGACPDCSRELAKAQAEKIRAQIQTDCHARDRWWVLKDLLVAALPSSMQGASLADSKIVAEYAMQIAKDALALLDAETPEHMK